MIHPVEEVDSFIYVCQTILALVYCSASQNLGPCSVCVSMPPLVDAPEALLNPFHIHTSLVCEGHRASPAPFLLSGAIEI